MPAPLTWSTACPDWADRLKRGKSIIPPPIFPAEAQAALDVFCSLRIVDAAGSPTFGDACEPWVFDFVAAIFGAYDGREGSETEGQRLIREAFMLIPKKNSKSTIAAGIMVTALVLNWRDSAELIILAPTIEIAKNSYDAARDMVKADPELEELLQVQDHLKTITHRLNRATLKVVAADNDTVGGKKASWVLIDEEWIFGKKPKASKMFREAIGGLASRPEGIVIKLTTQSDEPPAGIFKQDLEYARNVRDGKTLDENYLPVIYEYPADMLASEPWLDPSTYKIVNPNLGKSVSIDYLERELRKAQEMGEAEIRDLIAKHFNVEIGLNLRSDRWAGVDFWMDAADPTPVKSWEELAGRCEVITVGIDGGGLDDLLGLALIGREIETRRWLVWVHAWAHRIVLDRRKEIATALEDFRKQGDLTIVDDPGQDVAELAGILCALRETGLLPAERGIGVDPAGINDVVDELTSPECGFEIEAITAISQGWKLCAPIKTTERKVAGRELLHASQPLLTWCVSNARTIVSGNAVLINKAVSGTAKIDPLMALFNAAALMGLNPSGTQHDFSDFLSSPVIA